MWFIAANKTTRTVLESGNRSSDFGDSSFVNNFLIALSANYSTSVDNISLYTVADNSSDATRLGNGDQYTLTWSGIAPTGVVTGISFAVEDAKKWLQFNIDKSAILCDGVEKVIVGVQVMNSDNVNVDTTFNGDIDIPIFYPKGPVKMRFSFYLGIASKMLTTTEAGSWIIPSNQKRVNEYRVDNTVTFDSVL